MKIIAHRCNLAGPDPNRENKVLAMHECIEAGYDVEIDLWCEQASGKLYLGHDAPTSPVSWGVLAAKKEHLWVHCKNHGALHALTTREEGFNYFWHESDDYTLTSKGHIWAYPGKEYRSNSIIVMPEWHMEVGRLSELATADCYGICTDYPSLFGTPTPQEFVMENDLHLKLKKLVDSGIKLTPAKILFGVLFHEKLRGLSKHEQNQIALDAEVGFTTQTASTELSKGMELAPYVEVKECIRKLVGK